MIDQPRQSLFELRKRQLIAIAVLLVVGAGALGTVVVGGVYGIGPFRRNPADAQCQGAVNTARRIAPLVHGEVAAMNVAEAPLRIPDLAFRDGNAAEHHLSDWNGRTVLFNLWATWCIPCREEMPALDALEGKLGAPDFEVVAVNIDTRNPEKPRAWLKEVGVGKLAYYTDQSARVFQDLKAVGRAFGMPTTLLIDPDGCEIGTVAGPAEWASPDGVALVSAALGK